MIRLVTWGVAALVVGGISFGVVQLVRENGETSSDVARTVERPASNDWVLGNPNATVTLIEYSDLQCPACGLYHPVVQRVMSEFGDRIQFVYRHFPLRQIHPYAEAASRAAEAAGAQGKFWEMQDMLFDRQQEWSNSADVTTDFVGYAELLGLDAEVFRRDLENRDLWEKINRDYSSGVRAGVGGTPTFYLNGTKIQNPRNYDAFRTLINNALGS